MNALDMVEIRFFIRNHGFEMAMSNLNNLNPMRLIERNHPVESEIKELPIESGAFRLLYYFVDVHFLVELL
jgi:hypothetical protein